MLLQYFYSQLLKYHMNSPYTHSLTLEKIQRFWESATWSQMFYAASPPQPSYRPVPTSKDSVAKIQLWHFAHHQSTRQSLALGPHFSWTKMTTLFQSTDYVSENLSSRESYLKLTWICRAPGEASRTEASNRTWHMRDVTGGSWTTGHGWVR